MPHYVVRTIDHEHDPPAGPAAFIGAPGAGKTKLAWKLARIQTDRTGYPIAVIDPARASWFQGLPHPPTVREFIETVWGKGEHAAFTPGEDLTEAEKIIRAARAAGGVIVLLDELKAIAPSIRSMPLPLQLAARMWRWNNLPAIYATSQSYSDCARSLRSVVGEWFLFRMLAGSDVDDLEDDFRLPKGILVDLPEETYVRVKAGF